jgi:phage tail P2-like protein
MSNKDVVLANSIAGVPHFAAFDLIAKKRLEAIQLDALLVYLIDTVSEDALSFLADQFDVLGYKGLRLATTTDQKREVIKRAIELHRFKGTVWAVKEALKTIGYPDAVLTEHVGSGAGAWATFRIEIDAGSNPISAAAVDELVRMIDEYKNVRSHLLDISYKISFDPDAVTLADESYESPAVDDSDDIYVGGDFRYNGAYTYNGDRNYSTDTDILTVTII